MAEDSDPPNPRQVWVPVLRHLRKYPGRWARIRSFSDPKRAFALASNFRSGNTQLPPGNWRVRPVLVGNHSNLFIMFVSPSEDGLAHVEPGKRGRRNPEDSKVPENVLDRPIVDVSPRARGGKGNEKYGPRVHSKEYQEARKTATWLL